MNKLQECMAKNESEHGFWKYPKDTPEYLIKAEKIALMHVELSECTEAVRKSTVEKTQIPSDQLTGFTLEEEKMAELIIRILEYADHFELCLATAILLKIKYDKYNLKMEKGFAVW
jgi:hypothetical protein